MPKAISFFTGAGGLDLGLNSAGWDINLSVELEKDFCDTLRSNHPEWNIIQDDIMNYTKEKVVRDANLKSTDDIDLIVGGSPCQSFSTAGKRSAFSDSRGQAMLQFAKLVRDIKPKAFLLENVKGLLSAALKHRPLNRRGPEFPLLDKEEERGSAFAYLLSYFDDFNVEYKVLNAADFGVPQKRERVFIIGLRKDLNSSFTFPEPTHTNDLDDEKKKPWVPVSKVFRDLKNTTHHYVNYSDERLKYMRMIPKGGGNWRDLRAFGEDVVKEAMRGAYYSGGGKVGFYRRIHSDQPSPTLLTAPAQKSTNLGHPFEDRPLSIEEYLAIQEFPSDYKIPGTLGQKYVQIGNAVPFRLGKILGEAILESVESDSKVKVQN